MISPFSRTQPLNVGLLIKLAVIMAVLFLSAYLGRGSSLNNLMMLLAAGGALILLHKPELGLVGIMVAAISVPFTIGTGTNTPIHGAIILIPAMLLIWLLGRVPQRNLRLVRSPINLPLAALVVSASISFLAGGLPWNYFAETAKLQAQVGGLMVFLLSAGVFIVMANMIEDLRLLKVMTAIFIALGAYGFISREASNIVYELVVLRNTLVVSAAQGSLLWAWLVAMAAAQGFFNRSLSMPVRAACVGLSLMVIAGFYMLERDWASGWLPTSIAFGTLVFLRWRRLGIVLVMIGIMIMYPTIARLSPKEQYSADTRLLAAQIILTQVVPASPIIGLGPSNYYYYTQLYPILGYYVNFNSHNQYVDIIAQTGIVGLFVFLWLMLMMGVTGLRLRRIVKEPFSFAYINGCLAGIVATMVASALADWFLPFVYNIGLTGFRSSMIAWLFLGGMVAVGHIATRTPPAESAK